MNNDCCQRVVDQLAAGLAHEEERVGYLSNQTTLMMQILEEEGEGIKCASAFIVDIDR